MYGVLFGYAPEVFPTEARGTGDALTATANRLAGILAPIIFNCSSSLLLAVAADVTYTDCVLRFAMFHTTGGPQGSAPVLVAA